MNDTLPPALREALDDEFEVPGIGRLGITDSVRADRARFGAELLRRTHDLTWEACLDVIAALDAEAHDAE